MIKFKETKIYKLINKINKYNREYDINIMASSMAFYILNTIVSFSILFSNIIYNLINQLEDFVIVKFLNIINETFFKLLTNFNQRNGLTFFVVLNIIWACSKVIHSMNVISDKIYKEIDSRSYFTNRISSFLMFAMLLFITIFEITIAIYGNYLINKFITQNVVILKALQIIIELAMLFCAIVILYMHVPPKKLKFVDVVTGAVITTIAIYLIFIIFILFISIYHNVSQTHAFFSIISFSFLVLYLINYILVFGLVLNYQKDKKYIK